MQGMNAADYCRASGWAVGKEFVRFSVYRQEDIPLIGSMTMRITAIGDESILARFSREGKDYSTETCLSSAEFAQSYEPVGDMTEPVFTAMGMGEPEFPTIKGVE